MVNGQDEVTAVFAALADSTRRQILEHLSTHGETPVTVLAEPFQISLPAISRHLRVLEDARLIKRQRTGRMHLIRADAAGVKNAQRWIAHWVGFWESGFDALEEFLKNEQE